MIKIDDILKYYNRSNIRLIQFTDLLFFAGVGGGICGGVVIIVCADSSEFITPTTLRI